MSETNEQVVRRALEALSAGAHDRYEALHHSDYVNHEAAASRRRGPEAARSTAVFLHGAFEDLRLEPLDVIADGDMVAVRAQFSGRQVGEIDGFPATGRTCAVQHVHIFRLRDARIVEHWACRDDLGAVRQLGLLPSPDPVTS